MAPLAALGSDARGKIDAKVKVRLSCARDDNLVIIIARASIQQSGGALAAVVMVVRSARSWIASVCECVLAQSGGRLISIIINTITNIIITMAAPTTMRELLA